MQNIVNLLDDLNLANVAYVLVGGQAMRLHGSQRSTTDVDLVLEMSQENLDKFIEIAKKYKLKPIIPVAIDALKDSEKIQEWYETKGMLSFALREEMIGGLVIDVLVRSEISYEKLNERAVSGNLNQRTIRFASLEDLLVMKKAANRDKDQFDIMFLEAALR